LSRSPSLPLGAGSREDVSSSRIAHSGSRRQDRADTLLIYAACPSRLADSESRIMNFVAEHGNACLHPFNAFPYDYFEGGKIGREKTLEWCCRLIDACDELWLFGISAGTLFEVDYLIRRRGPSRIRVYVNEFDSEWDSYCQKYSEEFPLAMAAVRREMGQD